MASAACMSRARRWRRLTSRGSATLWSTASALGNLVARQGSRDDEPLDLAGALEQGVDLGVAVPLLDWEVTDVAIAAADLDRLLRDLHRHLAGLQLRHRAFRMLELASVAPLPQGPPDEGTRGLDLGRHVGEHER